MGFIISSDKERKRISGELEDSDIDTVLQKYKFNIITYKIKMNTIVDPINQRNILF